MQTRLRTLNAYLPCFCILALLVAGAFYIKTGAAYAQQNPINVALSSNGGVASASSSIAGYPASAVNNGDRKGINWGNGGGWNDSTWGQFPDWVRVDFGGANTISEIDVFTIQDNYPNPVEPYQGQTFALYGTVDFDVQYWDGSTWALVPNGSVRGNAKVWVQIAFPAVTTSAIRIVVYRGAPAYNDHSRIVELEAWGNSPSMPQPSPNPDDVGLDQSETEVEVATMLTDVAAASNGGSAVASSTYNGPAGLFAASSAIDSDRTSVNWANNGGWADNTQASYPDWFRVNFNDQKILSQIDLFTLRDNFKSSAQPTLEETFTQYGITDFEVQYLVAGSSPEQWIDVPGGNVTGNTNVWRKFTFPNITTAAIRIYVTGTKFPPPSSYSRIVELEAWGIDSLTPIFLPSGGASMCDPTNPKIPCALDMDLGRVIKGQSTVSDWTTQLDWGFSNWNGIPSRYNPAHIQYGTQNLPVLAHAIALWKGVSGSEAWWSTFLSCQTGDVCPYSNSTQYPYQSVKYFKGEEPFSNIYDYHATAAVVAVRYWSVRKLMANPSDANARDLGNKARRYLRLNWALYTLGAGKQSALKLLDRYNLANPGDQPCQQGISNYNGYFVALAGMRSTYLINDVCADDRAALLMEALEVPYTEAWPSTTLDLVRDIEAQPQMEFFDPGENVYALTPAHRNILITHVQDGSQAKFLTDFLSTVRISAPYHIIAWYDPTTGMHSIVSALEKNYNANTSAVYAYKYTEANRTAQILFPWSNKDPARCGKGGSAPYRVNISHGYAKFLFPSGSLTPSAVEASNIDKNDGNDSLNCVHEDNKAIVDSMSIPTTGWQYHIVFGPGQIATCTTANGTPCQ